MNAEVIAVGSELLGAGKVDTNSLFLARLLSELGIPLVRKSVVGDERDRLAEEIRRARDASGLVILSGGLGPTLDDLTREAASDATGRPLVRSEAVVRDIEERFRRMKRPMAKVNERQAYLLEGAEILANPRGTAPGQWLEDRQGILLLLPGPPRELEPMFQEACLPLLERHAPPDRFFVHTLRVAGIGESDVDQRIAGIYSAEPQVATTILSAPGDIQIHLRAKARDTETARSVAEGLGGKIGAALGDSVYSTDGRSLHATVGSLLRDRRFSVAVAESFTGGLLAGTLTDAAGSSDFFTGGLLTYSDAAKRDWLGVDDALLRANGAVSAEVAAAMAEAAKRRASQDSPDAAIGVSTTGYAGPTAGADGLPPGTAYFGICDSQGTEVLHRQFGGGRARVRALGVQTTLDLLRRRVLGLPLR